MKKRGELTTQQIVMLIILVVSFAIILFLIFRLDFGETTEKEICHNSVIMKSKSVLGSALDCKTNYVCISGGGDCDNFLPSETIEVDLNNPDAKEQIMVAIADEMADCWWMFGEGKVNYGETLAYSVKCAICSMIKFDTEIQNKFPDITYDELYTFLGQKKKDETQTYYKYLYRIPYASLFQPQAYFKLDTTIPISTNKKYAIVTGIDDEFWPQSDSMLRTNILSNDKLSNTDCGEFITKS